MTSTTSGESSGSPFHQVGSGSYGARGHRNNALCLFYSANMMRSNAIQSSRAPNSWIASLRSKHDQSSREDMDGRQYGHTLSAGTSQTRSYSSPSLMDDPFTSRMNSGAPSFYRSSSLESIQKNRRLRQLALQSTTKVRSLITRESTAEAERRRYIQSVLERRRRESQERRERFIRRPLENIIRQRAARKSQIQRDATIRPWDIPIVRQSILKHRVPQSSPEMRCAQHWIAKQAERRVRFDMQLSDSIREVNHEDDSDQNDDDQDDQDDTGENHLDMGREKLPTLPSAEGTGGGFDSSPIHNNNQEKIQRLPLLSVAPLSSGAQTDSDPSCVPSEPSWVERQVAKVKQRKLWVQQQQQQQQQQREKDEEKIVAAVQQQRRNPPPAEMRILKRSLSLLVNVSSESDGSTPTDSLPDGDGSLLDGTIPSASDGRLLAWEIWLDKEEEPESSKEEEIIPDAYSGWPHFPIRLAVGIEKRQKSLNEKRTSRTAKISTWNDQSNSLIRRKRFAKSLSMAVIRSRRRDNVAKSVLAIHQRSAAAGQSTDRQMDAELLCSTLPSEFTSKSIISPTVAAPGSTTIVTVDTGRFLSTNYVSLTVPEGSTTRLLPIIPEESLAATVAQEDKELASNHRPDEIPAKADDEIFDAVIADYPFETLVAQRPTRPPIPICDHRQQQPMMTDHLERRQGSRDHPEPSESIWPAANLLHEMPTLSIVSNDEPVHIFSSPLGHSDWRIDPVPGQASTAKEKETILLSPSFYAQQTTATEASELNPIKNGLDTEEDDYEEEGRMAGSRSGSLASTAQVQSGQETRASTPITAFVIRPGSPITVGLSSDCCALLDGEQQQQQQAVIIQAAKLDDRVTWPNQELGSKDDDDGPASWPARPAWIMASAKLISNQDDDNDDYNLDSSALPALSFRQDFEVPTSEGTGLEASTLPPTTLEENHSFLETATPITTSRTEWLDKKTKEARNVAKTISLVSISTQTEWTYTAEQVPLPPPPPQPTPPTLRHSSSAASSISSNQNETDTDDCQCLHRAVLTCLLPDSVDTLSSLESIRRHLKKARLRQQRSRSQPLPGRLDRTTTSDGMA